MLVDDFSARYSGDRSTPYIYCRHENVGNHHGRKNRAEKEKYKEQHVAPDRNNGKKIEHALTFQYLKLIILNMMRSPTSDQKIMASMAGMNIGSFQASP